LGMLGFPIVHGWPESPSAVPSRRIICVEDPGITIGLIAPSVHARRESRQIARGRAGR